jgi:transcription elongation factor GreB
MTRKHLKLIVPVEYGGPSDYNHDMSQSKDSKNYITPHGHQKLIEEYEQLLKVERPQVCALIQWAAGNGDRSENADYIYGKKRLREIDSRLRFLHSRLETAYVVDPQGIQSSLVQFGAHVEVEDQESGEPRLFIIVGIDESRPEKGFVSWQSPIGRGLLGKKCGDDVVIQTPQKILTYTLLTILYKEIEWHK